jgi:hypothetical protein
MSAIGWCPSSPAEGAPAAWHGLTAADLQSAVKNFSRLAADQPDSPGPTVVKVVEHGARGDLHGIAASPEATGTFVPTR